MACDGWRRCEIDPGAERTENKIDRAPGLLRDSSHRPVVTRVYEIDTAGPHLRGMAHRGIDQAPAQAAAARCPLDHQQKLHHAGAGTPIKLQESTEPLLGKDSEHERGVIERA